MAGFAELWPRAWVHETSERRAQESDPADDDQGLREAADCPTDSRHPVSRRGEEKERESAVVEWKGELGKRQNFPFFSHSNILLIFRSTRSTPKSASIWHLHWLSSGTLSSPSSSRLPGSSSVRLRPQQSGTNSDSWPVAKPRGRLLLPTAPKLQTGRTTKRSLPTD